MAQFVSDTFTDSDGVTLISHTGETGATWTKHSVATGNAEIQSNACKNSQASAPASEVAVYYASGSPASADYTVQVNLKKFGTPTIDSMALTGRGDTSAATWYFAQYSYAAGGWRLFKTVAGANTQLGSTVSEALTDGDQLKLRMSGTTIELYKKGEGTAAISATDSAISTAGKAGLRMFSSKDANGMAVDTFSADDIVAAGGAGPIIKMFRLINGGVLTEARLVLRHILEQFRRLGPA